MIKLSITIFVLFFTSSLKSKEVQTLSGIISSASGVPLKKISLTLYDSDESDINTKKTNKKGYFSFKNIKYGEYTIKINDDENGFNSVNITVPDGQNNDLQIKLNKIEIPDTITEEILKDTTKVFNSTSLLTNADSDINPLAPISADTLNTPLNTDKVSNLLPQIRPPDNSDRLYFEDQFFEYESNLRGLKNEIDSLKSIVTAFEKKQTMPNLSEELLDLIQVPIYEYKIELQNGTIVKGDIISESDSTIILKTQIGTLVLEKDLVTRKDKYTQPKPEIIFLDKPKINIYPRKYIFSGKVKNIGSKRADFIRIISNLFTQTTKLAGRDSSFVKGTKTLYSSGVIADTALEPGEIGTYNFPVRIDKKNKIEYHTMDINFDEIK